MYQGATTVYSRYGYTRTVELVYELTEKPLLFLDLGLIFPGYIIWEDREGNVHPLHAGVQYYGDQRLTKEEVVGREFRVPYGIEFEVESAQIGPEVPFSGQLFCEGGTYRMWYGDKEPIGYASVVTKATAPKEGYDLGHLGKVLRYAESDDGVNWREPQMDYVVLDGEKTNIVYGSLMQPEVGFSGSSVFIDPSADPAERYKIMFTGHMAPEQQVELAKRRGQQADPMSLCTGGGQLIFGATSPDGFEWHLIPEPIMFMMSESGNPYYDTEKQRYVTYIRLWHVMQRRAIGKAETEDFRDWPFPEPCLLPKLTDHPSLDFYTNAHTFYPGHDDIHLFFVAEYHRHIDRADISLAVSLDGDWFDFVPGGPVIAASQGPWDPEGPPECGCIFPGNGMVPFGLDQVGILYTAYNVPHKWPRNTQWQSARRWALWPRDRLVALKASEHGGFVTAGMMLRQPCIFINAETDMSGRIICELLDERGEPLPGYGFAESDPIVGDYSRKLLSWRGDYNLADLLDKKIFVRFQMEKAKLYSICAGEEV